MTCLREHTYSLEMGEEKIQSMEFLIENPLGGGRRESEREHIW